VLANSATEVVKEVTWRLHPTFRDPNVRCTKFPFEIKRRGWGVFEVDVTITLHSNVAEKLGGKGVIETSHYLDFKYIGDKVKLTEINVREKVKK
jgi:transcription initiation factor IIF auxiliary subunit